MRTKVFLSIISVLLVVVFFTTPHYNNWLFGNILSPPVSYAVQLCNLAPEQRIAIRYGPTYTVYEGLKHAFTSAHIAHPVILLPPPGYLQQVGVANIRLGTPPEFYYFTGYEGVFANSPHIAEAQWALVASKGGVALRRLKKEDRKQLVAVYQQFQSTQ